MARCFVLALLVACIVCAQSAIVRIDVPDEKAEYVVEDEVSPTTSSSVISSDSHGDKLADFTSDKTTPRPNRQRPTKKPGTYLQSIWDIYSS